MYENVAVGSLEEKTVAARNAMALDFDLHSLPLYADDANAQAMLPPPQPDKAYNWAEAMMDQRVPGEDIQFLAKHAESSARCQIYIGRYSGEWVFGGVSA